MANPGSQQAVDEAEKLGDIGFPEFTSKLVNDTFNAMVSSMIKQEQSYADLLEKAAMTLDEFASSTVPDHQVNTWLDNNLGTNSDGKNPVEAGNELSKAQAQTLFSEVKNFVSKSKLKDFNFVSENNGELTAKEGKVDDKNKQEVMDAVRKAVAHPRLNALEELVEKGVVRVAVDDGTIHTDLDFHTSGSDSHSQRSSQSEKNETSAHMDGGFVGEMFGIEAGASTKNVYVSSRHSKQTAQTSSNVDIQGHVKVNFRGDYEPLGNPNQGSNGGQSGNGGNN